MTDTASASLTLPDGFGLRRLFGRDPWTRAFLAVAARLAVGELTVYLPDGRSPTFSGAAPGPRAEIVLHDPATAARRLLVGGALAFSEAFVEGLWDSPDPVALMELAMRNEAVLDGVWKGGRLGRWLDRLRHLRRANTRSGSRRNIAFHYDLGNAFYRLWLDEGMQYSSALYSHPDMPLEAAQDAKLARIAELLDLSRPGLSVLEIGCGWGGLADHLVRGFDARMTGLTLSREQLLWARRRLRGTGADMRYQDYRDVQGSFDRIVSIEMIEAVGEARWPRYFATLRDRLKPGGSAVVQSITIADDRFDAYRAGTDFIQKHIFPGGMLPSPAALRAQAAAAGLEVTHMESFGPSYALTVAEWRRRFQDAWPKIAAQGFDERFRRLWLHYLDYCEAGFRGGSIDVSLWRFTKPAA